MADINREATPATTPKFFPVIGKAWINKSKKGTDLINIVLGNRREPFASITLKPNDKIMLRPNNKREGKKDADFQVVLPS